MTATITTQKRAVGWLLILLIIGCWLRVWGVGRNDLWFDEVFARNLATSNSLWDIARNQGIGDLHPPLYFMLLHSWIRLAGDSPVALRMLSALAVMLAIPAYYHLARLLFEERAGRIALILAVLSPLPIYYGQEARNYSLSILFGTYAAWGLVALLRGKRYGAPLYIAAAVAGMYAHYFNGLALAAVHLWIVLYAPARRQWRRWLSADVVIALLFAPQLIQWVSQLQAISTSYWIPKPNPAAPITTLTFLLFGMTLPRIVDIIGIVVVIAALAIITLDMVRRAPRRVRPYWWLCIGTVIVMLLGVMAISLIRSSIYLDKSFAVLSPFLISALAAGVAYARKPSPAPYLVYAVMLLMGIGLANHILSPDPAKPPFRTIAADLSQRPDSANVPILLLHDAASLPIGYYAPDLIKLMRIVNLGEQSWLYPQSALFPQTWDRWGYTRLSREDMLRWLSTYQGKLRVIATSNLEPPEQEVLAALRQTACTQRVTNYLPFVAVFDFELGNCLALR